eukprot:TRINITY_DN15596_c0_g2_i1.p1 TRINITY_DN15596_c0_g2~~TRINITY_DN15596_c0_g2_i1.p1  ORF type:complete len:432 (-),score=96.87 TRINITY_DN15596_c0_g2_i1:343-1638(-)
MKHANREVYLKMSMQKSSSRYVALAVLLQAALSSQFSNTFCNHSALNARKPLTHSTTAVVRYAAGVGRISSFADKAAGPVANSEEGSSTDVQDAAATLSKNGKIAEETLAEGGKDAAATLSKNGKIAEETLAEGGKDAAETLSQDDKDAEETLAEGGKDAAETLSQDDKDAGIYFGQTMAKGGKEAAEMLANTVKHLPEATFNEFAKQLDGTRLELKPDKDTQKRHLLSDIERLKDKSNLLAEIASLLSEVKVERQEKNEMKSLNEQLMSRIRLLETQNQGYLKEVSVLQKVIDKLADKNYEAQKEVGELKKTPRQKQEDYYSQMEINEIKMPLVSSVSETPKHDKNKHYPHLSWWFEETSPLENLGGFEWRSHSRTAVLYVVEGELRIEADGKINVAYNGEKIVVPSGTLHRIPPGSPTVQVAIAGGEAS